MRRAPALVVAGLALFLAAACGGDGEEGDGASPAPPATSAPTTAGGNEEVCAAAEQLLNTLDSEGNPLRDALVAAAESGDAQQLSDARSDYLAFTDGIVEALRGIAATAEDPELGTAMESFAAEFEAVADEVADDPEQAENVDTSELQAAAVQVGGFCE